MHIIITGGSGFLGVRLARRLLLKHQLALRDKAPQLIQKIVLVDRIAPPADLAEDSRIQFLMGDLNQLLEIKSAETQSIWA